MSQNPEYVMRFVYSQLKSLSAHLPEIAFENDAAKYNALVDRLVAIGFEADEYRLDPQRDMYYPVTGLTWDGQATYGSGPEVNHGELGRQVNALLTFFHLVQSNTSVVVDLPRNDQ
jgi:hypothetical protein